MFMSREQRIRELKLNLNTCILCNVLWYIRGIENQNKNIRQPEVYSCLLPVKRKVYSLGYYIVTL